MARGWENNRAQIPVKNVPSTCYRTLSDLRGPPSAGSKVSDGWFSTSAEWRGAELRWVKIEREPAWAGDWGLMRDAIINYSKHLIMVSRHAVAQTHAHAELSQTVPPKTETDERGIKDMKGDCCSFTGSAFKARWEAIKLKVQNCACYQACTTYTCMCRSSSPLLSFEPWGQLVTIENDSVHSLNHSLHHCVTRGNRESPIHQ